MCPADGGFDGMPPHAAIIRLAASTAAKGEITSGRKRIPDLMGTLKLG
jgi:hypothetical protein